jgi:hypothetical protein
MKSRFFATIFCAALVLGFSAPATAAVIDLSTLYVGSVSVTFDPNSILAPPETDTTSYAPPVEWVLGEYQGAMVSGSIGTVNYTVEPTGPSSGTVDTTLGTIDLVLSNLHMTVSGLYISDTDFDIWNISTSTIFVNSYDPLTGAFVYGWRDSASILSLNGNFSFPVDYSIEISGTASPVPLPAAVWLFGSGLAGLISLRKKFRK